MAESPPPADHGSLVLVGANGYCGGCAIPRQPDLDGCPNCRTPYPLPHRQPPAGNQLGTGVRPRPVGVGRRSRFLLYAVLAATILLVLGVIAVEVAATI